jgi:GntR family transcriptional regulator/MocR family aminotransferase
MEAAKYVADWHTALPAQAALAQFIDRGWFARHVRRMRNVYRERHGRILEILARTMADELRVIPSSVGLHLTATAPETSNERVLGVLGRASAVGVECMPLSLYAAGDTPRPGIVIGYGAIATDQIDEGLRRLRECFTARPEHRRAS